MWKEGAEYCCVATENDNKLSCWDEFKNGHDKQVGWIG